MRTRENEAIQEAVQGGRSSLKSLLVYAAGLVLTIILAWYRDPSTVF
jgi:hypothetical protein